MNTSPAFEPTAAAQYHKPILTEHGTVTPPVQPVAQATLRHTTSTDSVGTTPHSGLIVSPSDRSMNSGSEDHELHGGSPRRSSFENASVEQAMANRIMAVLLQDSNPLTRSQIRAIAEHPFALAAALQGTARRVLANSRGASPEAFVTTRSGDLPASEPRNRTEKAELGGYTFGKLLPDLNISRPHPAKNLTPAEN